MAKQKIPAQQIAKDDKALETALSMVNKQFGEGSSRSASATPPR